MTATLKTTRQGQQVVRGPVTEVRVGQMLVANSPHGGALRTVTVVSLGRPFTADGGQMVYGYLTAAPAGRSVTQRRSAGTRGQACDECGRPGARHECVDSSGIGGVCCDRCASAQPYQRSFC